MDWQEIYQRLLVDRNDRQAWLNLEQRVRRWARTVLIARGTHAIDDAVADTCAAAVLNLDAARGAETFAGFVYGHFLNVRRGVLKTAYPLTLELNDFDVPAPTEEDGPDPTALLRLRSALAALPPRERRAVTLRYFDEQSSTAIGSELGVTRGNARRIVHNGLRGLRRHFRQPPHALRT
ncbi:MAG TPA: sigma-70 family RNA polymerase sigma factor [Chloroflexota bacterium]